jgi:hypothetical protein
MRPTVLQEENTPCFRQRLSPPATLSHCSDITTKLFTASTETSSKLRGAAQAPALFGSSKPRYNVYREGQAGRSAQSSQVSMNPDIQLPWRHSPCVPRQHPPEIQRQSTWLASGGAVRAHTVSLIKLGQPTLSTNGSSSSSAYLAGAAACPDQPARSKQMAGQKRRRRQRPRSQPMRGAQKPSRRTHTHTSRVVANLFLPALKREKMI